MDHPQERRIFARVALTTRVRVTFSDINARRQLLLDNLSEGGLFLKLNRPKPVGTRVRFDFALREGGVTIAGEGVVRWIETDPQKTKGMGIEFLSLNDEGKREIAEILRTKRFPPSK